MAVTPHMSLTLLLALFKSYIPYWYLSTTDQPVFLAGMWSNEPNTHFFLWIFEAAGNDNCI